MTVTVVGRWTTPNAPASIELAKRARQTWIKLGALDMRANQVFTGPFTGQYIIATVFADMAAYAKASAAAATNPDIQGVIAENAKIGAVLQEREILTGIDL
jgi:ABC-type sugar transport system substrate-binding protein